METSGSKINSKKGMKYQKIDKESRLRLLELVKDERVTIKMAAKELGLSPSTARAIIFKYEQEGKIYMPKLQRENLQRTE